ncbi:hypothetical protein BH11MYX2_BH11MYX2_11270 [soil metagenome]
MLVRVAAVLCSVAIAGCYSPSVAPCIYTCAGEACPSGLTCNADIHMCVENVGDSCNGPRDDSGTDDDAGVDAALRPDATSCGWPGLSNVDPCAIGADMTADVWVASGIVNTDARTGFPASVHPMDVTMPGGRIALAVPLDAFAVKPQESLLIIGEKPLIIVARTTATIAGTITVTGTITTVCPGVLSGMTYVGAGASGGGGGGGYGARGGPGGTGNTDAAMMDEPAGAGGTAGTSVGADEIIPLRGGCPGGKGGDAGTLLGGLGGAGGGAIQISSKGMISVGTAIIANGAGGFSITADHVGGGGGGAGGAILLDAPVVSFGVGAMLCANGGGGGAANSGKNGTTAVACESATGGAGITADFPDNGAGGRGGFGSTMLQRAGDKGNSPESVRSPGYGGGGGGGGAGRIRLNVTSTMGSTAPSSPAISFGTLPSP